MQPYLATVTPSHSYPFRTLDSPNPCLRWCIAGVLALGHSQAVNLPAAFIERAEEAGLFAGDESYMDHNTGGVWVVDINEDGWPDIFTTRLEGGCRLFINQQDGTFEEEAQTFGLKGPDKAHGALFGDIDNDGDQDLLLGLQNGERNYLYLNNGDGDFTEVAEVRGVALEDQNLPHRSYGGTWTDYDADGYLDLHLPEWFDAGTQVDSLLHTALLRNLGSQAPGHFENRTESAGVSINTAEGHQHAFASAAADMDQDGWPDLLVTGDYGTSYFFRNNGDGSFTDSTQSVQANKAQNAMGITIGDFDGDLHLDFYETSIYDNPGLPQPRGNTGNRLYQYRPDRENYSEISASRNVREGGFGWGTTFVDFDNDGDLDLLATNAVLANDGSIPEATRFWVNDGDGNFTEMGAQLGITDSGNGYGVTTLDYDKDGDLDLLIGQRQGQLLLYENEQGNANSWLQIRLQGTLSNRDAIGAKILVSPGGSQASQYIDYNPSNLFMAQSESAVQIGLGPELDQIEEINIVWPSGVRQNLQNIATGQTLSLIEPEAGDLNAPSFTLSPIATTTLPKAAKLELSIEAEGNPAPSIQWYRNGEPIPGAIAATLELNKIRPHQAGIYKARLSNPLGSVYSTPATVIVERGDAPYSVARWWNELLLDAIRKDFPAPTVHARNLYHTSAAMWDSFWAYETDGWQHASPVFHQESPLENAPLSEGDRLAAQEEAISYAAYQILRSRYQASDGAIYSLPEFRWLMEQLGYDPDFSDTEGSSPAAVGNRIAAAVLNATFDDGANEAEGYQDPQGYTAANDPLIFKTPGTDMLDPNRWQPLAFDKQITQNGIELAASIQEFVGSHWGGVETYALDKLNIPTSTLDPGNPPQLSSDNSTAFIQNAVEVIRFSSHLDPTDDTRIDISPGARFNNQLGQNDGNGYSLNPTTGQPYEANLVKRADYGRVLAEFWADGPSSETPPGHWNALLNEITEHPQFESRYAGMGPPLPQLQWDITAYLTLNGAMHDAAITAWGLKRDYDYSRPISMIRYLAELGQSSDSQAASYHPQGLPLEPSLIELITAESAAIGQRHEALANSIGEIAIWAWQGEPEDPHTQSGGVGWIRASEWIPYQRSTFVTPAFAAYISGHSCFSRAGAEVLTLLTGSPYFPGGLGEFNFSAYDYLEFETGPSETLSLQWATYYDAADQAGISRLYGGIHVAPDDVEGRIIGSKIGLAAFLRTQSLIQDLADKPNLAPLTVKVHSPAKNEALLAAFISTSPQNLPLTTEQGLGILDSNTPHRAIVRINEEDRSTHLQIPGDYPVSGFSIHSKSKKTEIHFQLTGDTPRFLFIRSLKQSQLWPSPIWATSDTENLSLYSLDSNNTKSLIANNTNWKQDKHASLAHSVSSLIPGPHSELEADDAALFIQIEPGYYILTVGDSEEATQNAVELRVL